MTPEAYQAKAEKDTVGWTMGSVDTPVSMMRRHESQPPIYAYRFNYGAYHKDGYNAWPTNVDGINFAIWYGACHGLDIPFFWRDFSFFGQDNLIFPPEHRAGYQALNDGMMAYVAQFAHTDAPGDAGGVFWQPWSNAPDGPKRILFDADATRSHIEMSRE